MFSGKCLLFLAVVVLAVNAMPSKGSTKASLQKKCLKECPDDYTPVCGADSAGQSKISFGNECVLSNYNCENNKELNVLSKGECPGGGSVRLQ